MDPLSNSDAWVGGDLLPSSIFGNEISRGNSWIEIHIADDLDGVVRIKNFYSIFLSLQNYSNNILCRFFQVIFLFS